MKRKSEEEKVSGRGVRHRFGCNINSAAENGAAIGGYLAWIGYDLNFGGNKMIASHSFPSIYYGLMQGLYDHKPGR